MPLEEYQLEMIVGDLLFRRRQAERILEEEASVYGPLTVKVRDHTISAYGVGNDLFIIDLGEKPEEESLIEYIQYELDRAVEKWKAGL